ncbi:helix-turn-helix transcriptional regulator [Clostridium tyrobutyricum]|nr:helix-turn-helix transcriptional regulator [Clostridium tyrobutyricum]
MMKQSIKTELGRIIKSKRIEKNFTQNKVADATNISRNYLSDIENGRYVPSVDTLTKIARFLNMDLNFLLKMTEIQDKI